MTNCRREKCLGASCGNFVPPEKGGHGCKGVDWTRPPWVETDGRLTTAEHLFREQDYRAWADKLGTAVEEFLAEACTVTAEDRTCCWNCTNCDEPKLKAVCEALVGFKREREGARC